MPLRGRYVGHPAITDERGIVSVPPPMPDPFPSIATGTAMAGIALYALWRSRAGVRGG